MVDALHPEQVERLAHVVRAALLARVGHQPKTFGRRQLVHPGEQRRRVADLGGVEPDADELVPERRTGPQHRVGGVRAQVAQEARDQVGGDLVVPGAVGQRSGQPAEHLLQRHPVGQVRLRVEEDLRPAHPGRRGPGQVGPGQVVEVLLDLQHAQVGIVQVEEGLQHVEPVLRTEFVHVQGRHPGAVAPGQLDQQLGLKCAPRCEYAAQRPAAYGFSPTLGPPVTILSYRDGKNSVLSLTDYGACPGGSRRARLSVAGPDVGVIVFHHVDGRLLRASGPAVDADVTGDEIGLTD